MKTARTLSVICGLLVAIFGTASGQISDNTSYGISTGSKIWFDGTSTLHGFKAVSDSVDGSVTVRSLPTVVDTAMNALQVSGADVSIRVRTLKSGDEGLDKNMYKSIKIDKFPRIRYKLISAEVNDSADTAKGTVYLKTKGNLSIAGITRQIEMNAELSRTSDGEFLLKGMKPILMSKFGIEPPTMMFGIIKVGDKVVVYFKIHLRPLKPKALTKK